MADTSSIFSSNNTYIADLKSQALAALGRLETAALSAAFSWSSYERISVEDPTGVHQTADLASILPDFDTIVSRINDIEPDYSSFPDSHGLAEIDRYRRHVWEEQQLDDIQTALSDLIEGKGLPDKSYQDAIFQYGKERINKTFDDAVDLLKAKHSGYGFKYANGMLNADIERLMIDRNNELTDRSRKIEELLVNWAKDNLHFALQQGVAVESLQMDFAYKFSAIYREMFLAQLNGIMEKFKARLSAEVSKLESRIKSIVATTEAYNANSTIEGRKDSGEIEKVRTEIQQSLQKYQSDINALAEENRARLGAASAYANTAASLMQSSSNSMLGVITKKE